MRNQDTMKVKFVTVPNDVFTIKMHSNVLSDSLWIVVDNPNGEHFDLTFKNRLDAWKLLKQLNEMGARTVQVQLDDNEPIPFEDSEPYKYRFGKK